MSCERVGHGRKNRYVFGLHGGSGHGHEDVTAQELTVEDPCACKTGRLYFLYEVGDVSYWSGARDAE